MRKAFLILAAALIAAAPVAAAVTATPTEAAQKEIKKKGGKGGGKHANASRKVSPKGQAKRNKNKVRSTAVRGGNSRHNKRYANNHRHNHHHYNRHRHGHRYYYRPGYGWGWWAPSAFAAGVVAGAVVATPRVYAAPGPVYYEGAANRIESNAGRVPPAGGYAAFSPGWYEYCSSKYRSFNPNTGTYTGYDGLTHYCQ
jgi:Ni/Co efflux regulator RcnB